MDIDLLKTFLEVKHTRHFGKAAENLYLTQAAVSARIKQLEMLLDVALFSRYRNNLQLTVSGERLVKHAESILLAWDLARQDVALIKEHKTVLALGATSGLWDLLMMAVLQEIHVVLPDVALRAESYSHDQLARMLLERTLDLGLLYEPAKVSELESVPVSHAELFLISTDTDKTAQDCMTAGYVAVDWGYAFDVACRKHFPEAQLPVLHTTQARIALEFIQKNGGSAYLPYRLVAQELGRSLFVVNDAPIVLRPIYACFRKDSEKQDVIEKTMAIVQSLSQGPK
ncbi:MAG: LysR family transcriptional regulator [Hahellaceae bacterium]|nr:LysR family transcriptional regulator [Hahellaceae bacterium]MCP5209811.1 LysR family transcriptional regulator [Hahellaceae bacterium]